MKAQVPGVSMPPPPLCTDADDLLRCSATVGNLGERGKPDILTSVRHWDLLRALRTEQSKQDLHFKHESELHMSASAGKRTRGAWTTGEHATIKPPMQTSVDLSPILLLKLNKNYHKKKGREVNQRKRTTSKAKQNLPTHANNIMNIWINYNKIKTHNTQQHSNYNVKRSCAPNHRIGMEYIWEGGENSLKTAGLADSPR